MKILCLFAGQGYHDLHLFHAYASDLNQFYRSTKRIRIQEFFLPKVPKIITDAYSTSQEIHQKWNIPREKIQVVPLGCDHVKKWIGNTKISINIQKSI